MDKITFSGVTVELTRRCDMACLHCMRGNAMDADISLSHIDEFLDQADIIDTLSLTGGEPGLALDAAEYIADGLIKRGILLLSINLASNGFTYSERLVEVLKKYRRIIDISCGYGFAPGTYNPKDETHRVILGISLDRFHSDHAVCEAHFEQYKAALDGIADVVRIFHGNVPFRIGRAVCLPKKETVYDPAISYHMERQTIELLSENHTPICRLYNNFKLIDPGQRIVCCPIWLGSDGIIRSSVCASSSYEQIDNYPAVCKVTDDIWSAIVKYNKGRINCTQLAAENEANITPDEVAEIEHYKKLKDRDDAQDDPTTDAKRIQQKYLTEAINAGNITDTDIYNFIDDKIRKENMAFFDLDTKTIAQESAEYHHGSGKLPEYRQPKPKPTLDMSSFIANFDKSARCKRCGSIIVDRDGNPVNSGIVNHERGGAYYHCKLCNGISFAFDFTDMDAILERVEQMEKEAAEVASDKSRRCGWCGKVVINSDGKYIHCSEDFYNPGRIVCHYCKHQI